MLRLEPLCSIQTRIGRFNNKLFLGRFLYIPGMRVFRLLLDFFLYYVHLVAQVSS